MPRSAEELVVDETFRSLIRRVLTGKSSLFLGAGASLSSGAPTTDELAKRIATDVLMTEGDYSLGEIVDYSDAGPGRRRVIECITEALASLSPSPELQKLSALPWASIFTVNFDDLIEQSFEQDGRTLATITAPRELDTPRLAGSTPLIKLHGSIRNPNDQELGFVITQHDFIRSETLRRSLYRLLMDRIEAEEVILVGFALRDPDFLRVINDVHEAVDRQLQLVPRAYAVIPDPPPFARQAWDQRKVELVDATMEEFIRAVELLRRPDEQLIRVGSEPILPSFLHAVDPASAEAEELAWAFEFPDLDDGTEDATLFLRGGEATWQIIREGFDAARELFDDVTEDLMTDANSAPPAGSRGTTKSYLVTAPAGYGKTTLAKRIAWELQHNWSQPVLWTRYPARLQLDLIELASKHVKERLFVFIDNAADAGGNVTNTIQRAQRRRLPISFVIIERMNEWQNATTQSPIETDNEYQLDSITDIEARNVIAVLSRANELGALEPLADEERVQRLVERAGRELLVGLREVTEDERFDRIVINEYHGIPSPIGQRAYLVVCGLYQFGIPVRAGLLSRATGIPIIDLPERVLEPTKRIIVEDQVRPWEQPTFRARHSVIAQLVFSRSLPSSADKSGEIGAILRQLDYGYRDDRRAFLRLISARWLRDNGLQPGDIAQLYDLARRLRPNDATVVQQEALSLRFEDPLSARRLLNEASELAPRDDTIQHSQAVLILDEAKATQDPDEARRLFDRAEEEFERLRRRNPDNAANYVSLIDVCLARAERSEHGTDRMRFIARGDRIASSAFEACPPTAYLLEAAAQVETAAGNIEAAEEDMHAAAVAAGNDPHMWRAYARFLARHRGPQAAIEALNEALDFAPADGKLNYELARFLEQYDEAREAEIVRAYEYAVDDPATGFRPALDLAIYLDLRGRGSDAEAYFAELRAMDLPYRLKSQARRWLTDESGERKVFDAEILERYPRTTFVAIPGVPDRIFISPYELSSEDRRGDRVQVHLFYNAFGLRATPASH